MKLTEQQLKTGCALSAYNALMRWFDRAAGVQISGEDSVKCALWLDQILKLIKDSPEYQFASENYLDIWPVALEKVKAKLGKIKEGAKNEKRDSSLG